MTIASITRRLGARSSSDASVATSSPGASGASPMLSTMAVPAPLARPRLACAPVRRFRDAPRRAPRSRGPPRPPGSRPPLHAPGARAACPTTRRAARAARSARATPPACRRPDRSRWRRGCSGAPISSPPSGANTSRAPAGSGRARRASMRAGAVPSTSTSGAPAGVAHLTEMRVHDAHHPGDRRDDRSRAARQEPTRAAGRTPAACSTASARARSASRAARLVSCSKTRLCSTRPS